MTPLEAEITVAVLGLDAILRGTPSWTVGRQEDAASFEKRARALILKALVNTEPGTGDDEDAFDYDEASELLQNVGEEQNEALFSALPDDIQDDVSNAATRAIEHLQAIQPRRVTKTTAREVVEPPEPYELDRFARAWRVGVDPMSALRNMSVGALDMVQVDALEAMYPEIYKRVAREGGLLDDAIATMKTRRGDKWDVTDGQDRQVKILIGADPIDFDLANDFAELGQIAQPPPPKKPTGGSGDIKPTDELLPSQKQA